MTFADEIELAKARIRRSEEALERYILRGVRDEEEFKKLDEAVKIARSRLDDLLSDLHLPQIED